MDPYLSIFPDALIYVVDDSPQNARLLEIMLGDAGYTQVHACTDSREAQRKIANNRPDLVILDLHMPAPDGFEILRSIRENHPEDDAYPVLVFTGDTTPETRRRALEAGASDFLTKPTDETEFLLRVRNFLHTRRTSRELLLHRAQLESEIERRTFDLQAAQRSALETLGRAAEFRDDNTGDHTRRIGRLSAAIARSLDRSAEEVARIELTAPLHDLGKIAVPDAILLKPGRLDERELGIMRSHTVVGAEVLSADDSPLMRLARDIALCHHERWDGQGYPNGRMREDIPLAARIVAVADVYDALLHIRPYKKAWGQKEAHEEILRQSGRQFDPDVVDAFIRTEARAAKNATHVNWAL